MGQAQYQHEVDYSDGVAVLDAEGFLANQQDWSRAFTELKALEADIELNDRHWHLIEIIRDKYLRLGALPPMRIVCKAAGIEKQELKQQFGSCLNLWKIAGLPNPGEEARAYMS